MRLHNLKPRPGAKHRRKRLGHGDSSGRGKTSGRGHKGHRARSGRGFRPGFEGGQMPLIRRLPKRGFSNARHATVYIPVNVAALDVFPEGSVVDDVALQAARLANGRASGIKILGNGEISKKLTVKVQAFSAVAKAKIEAAGGKWEIVPATQQKKPEPQS